MSVVHELLSQLEETEVRNSSPWLAEENQRAGRFTFDLPDEILNDFYDLKEHVRIANMRGQMRVLSVASSLPGEGSSTIATYLAYLLTGQAAKKAPTTEAAELLENSVNKQTPTDNIFSLPLKDDHGSDDSSSPSTFLNDTLLVDANFHQPGLHNFFGLRVEGGLADILEHQVDWKKCVKPIQQLNLKVITAGVSDILPAELLGTESFRNLIKEWRATFNYVIFDSAPVLKYVDALTLATSVDGTILVVCAGKTRWEIAQDAKRKLAGAQANLLGVALNRSRVGVMTPVTATE
jgi:capsular exopolysaccharide synthesis family protein